MASRRKPIRLQEPTDFVLNSDYDISADGLSSDKDNLGFQLKNNDAQDVRQKIWKGCEFEFWVIWKWEFHPFFINYDVILRAILDKGMVIYLFHIQSNLLKQSPLQDDHSPKATNCEFVQADSHTIVTV